MVYVEMVIIFVCIGIGLILSGPIYIVAKHYINMTLYGISRCTDFLFQKRGMA